MGGYAMPIHKLLYIEKYEAMLNGAMKYSLEFDTPNEEIIGFMAYIGSRKIAIDSISLRTAPTENLLPTPTNGVPLALLPKKTACKR